MHSLLNCRVGAGWVRNVQTQGREWRGPVTLRQIRPRARRCHLVLPPPEPAHDSLYRMREQPNSLVTVDGTVAWQPFEQPVGHGSTLWWSSSAVGDAQKAGILCVTCEPAAPRKVQHARQRCKPVAHWQRQSSVESCIAAELRSAWGTISMLPSISI